MTLHRGFNMIELMITLTILGFLLMLGLPSIAEWMQNTQVRTAAEGILNGLQTARSEAVQRNLNVQLVLGNQSAYTVSVVTTGEVIRKRSETEGSSSALVAITPNSTTTVTFNGFGRVIPTNADASPAITQIDVSSSALATARNMRVVVGSGVRMCDPQVATGDPRAC
jgi:type IV fimbrial biogenesis protein FimT